VRFGTDGIRGEAGRSPIDAAGARAVGAAAAAWARSLGHGRVLVVRDTRPSGAELAAAVLLGVTQGGGVALDGGVQTTSAAQAALGTALADVGVVVTASHNPAGDNGFKVLGPGGRKPGDEETARLEAGLVDPTGAAGRPAARVDREVQSAYGAVFKRALGGQGALRGRRVVVDLANGAAVASRAVVERLLDGLEVVWLHAGDGVINDGVGSEHPERLAAAVVAGGFDAGIAVDGDGDRCLLIDEAGAVVPGDALLGLLARGLGARQLVVTVMSSTSLEATLEGVEILRTGVGDRHVAEAMRRSGAPLGGEESGHVLFADAMAGGDGLLTGLRALSCAWAAHPSLSAAAAPLRPFPRRLTKVRSASRADVTDAVADVVAAATARLGAGRVFIRWSGTEPVLRVLVEGPDAAVVEEESARVTDACARAVG
jgi:phosphoglucosamine mutase